MNKNMIFILCLLIAVLLTSACTAHRNEVKGVPEHIVMREISERYEQLGEAFHAVTHKISHNVDRQTHTDMVTVELEAADEYGKETEQIVLKYQYDKGNDLWTLLPQG